MNTLPGVDGVLRYDRDHPDQRNHDVVGDIYRAIGNACVRPPEVEGEILLEASRTENDPETQENITALAAVMRLASICST